MKVIVTQEHIDKGTPESACNCPIALALKDMGAKDVCVNQGYIEFQLGDEYWWAEPPTVADEFIEAFDDQEQVNPFEFDILNDYVPDIDEDDWADSDDLGEY